MKETFIGQYYIDDVSICDEIIEYFKNSPNKNEGKVGFGDVDKNMKESTDLYLDNNDLANTYGIAFQKVLDKYIKHYEYCNKYQPFGLIEKVNIQHYLPKQGFHQWHTERTSKQDLVGSRHLVFMTYLNDVNDGGETEFYYQELKVKPKKGLTLIWPADWTHTHRGITSNTEDKYILTGWLNFIN